jgi:hypothetical protein
LVFVGLAARQDLYSRQASSLPGLTGEMGFAERLQKSCSSYVIVYNSNWLRQRTRLIKEAGCHSIHTF